MPPDHHLFPFHFIYTSHPHHFYFQHLPSIQKSLRPLAFYVSFIFIGDFITFTHIPITLEPPILCITKLANQLYSVQMFVFVSVILGMTKTVHICIYHFFIILDRRFPHLYFSITQNFLKLVKCLYSGIKFSPFHIVCAILTPKSNKS